MALYEYELFLVREADRGEIYQELVALGLMEPAESSMIRLPFNVYADWSESTNRARADTPVQVLAMTLNSGTFEAELRVQPAAFVDWLWSVADRATIAYAFMSAGSYAAYYEAGGISSEMVFHQVGDLVATGEVRFAHPVMFLAERLGNGRACATAREAPLFRVEHRPNVGCLLMLIDGDAQLGPVEILDPGPAYERLSRHFVGLR
jgi:hypothetical protein